VKELVELIAKALVDSPDKVQVSLLEGEQTTILELKVAQEDLGKVIGKQGRTARAIRSQGKDGELKLRLYRERSGNPFFFESIPQEGRIVRGA
jgi:predicted RNA-binding protein YlqC (UPF0109 family)